MVDQSKWLPRCKECGKNPVYARHQYLPPEERCKKCDLDHERQVAAAQRAMR